MLNDKQKILNNNDFLNDRKNAKVVSSYNRAKRKNLIISVLLCLIIIGTFYLISDVSNIKGIEVKGNIYLNEEDIVSLSGLNSNSKYVFVNTQNVKDLINNETLIDACEVIKNEDKTITITVKEKKAIGYSFEDQKNVIILDDDSRIIVTKEKLYLINKLPLIEGFNKEQLILIEKNLKDIDYKIINEISEIHYYPNLKFQDHEIIMSDGNYIFTSVYGIDLISKYHNMASVYDDDKNRCFYIEDISKGAYTSACPWEPKEEIVNDPKVEDIKDE